MPLLRWSGLTPHPSEEDDVTNGGGASESELGSGHLLLGEAVGGPGLEASPSVSAGGGAHWPKRQAMVGVAWVKKHLINELAFGCAAKVAIRSGKALNIYRRL